jgi:hypothetical protein
MRRRSIAMAALIAGLVVISDVGVRASVNGYRAHRLNRQNLGTILRAETSSTSWIPLPGLGPSSSPSIQALHGLAATLSVTVSGAPVQFKIVLEIGRNFVERPMNPRSVTFRPGAEPESFSYTFVSGRSPGTVNFLWRSPTGAPVTETRGTFVLQYTTRG